MLERQPVNEMVLYNCTYNYYGELSFQACTHKPKVCKENHPMTYEGDEEGVSDSS